MRSWNRPSIPTLPGYGPIPQVFDSVSQSARPARPDGVASLYVCGITPYDATHLGHAATYLAYDILVRLWLDAGFTVNYVQNVTDVDDPLLERAIATGVDWQDLAAEQTELFRHDMEHLRIVPPDHYVAVTEAIAPIAAAVKSLLDRGIAYTVESPDAAPDIYFDTTRGADSGPWFLGRESNLDRATMLELSAERGGDPDRPGKRDPLDPLLWRSERPGEPAWDSPVGRGRPGWHIECTVIGLEHLTSPITVNGGGRDLIFPHHEYSAGHSSSLTGRFWSAIYSHAGMVAYQGEKMSKSLGNLVLVSRLVASGVDPRVIRLALLAEDYKSDWEWTDDHLCTAEKRLAAWEAWAAKPVTRTDTALLDSLRIILATDLNTPGALRRIDEHIASGAPATPLLVDAIDALLGIRLVGP
ncbi:MAG: cysteine--1-D-myo-inosityl 2-amino-2-deoxy-alpha-D-glucopyranoside ligase [Terrimesophilobacter sp.]